MAKEIELIDGERQRISIDLHDELGSGLAAVGLLLQQAPDDTQGVILERVSSQLMLQQDKIKEIAHGLIPRLLDTHGLSVAISDLSEEIRAAGKIRLQLHLHINDTSYKSAKSVHLYRIIREILTNAIKHASANEILMSCVEEKDILSLTVKDNGVGFDQQNLHEQGLGLQSIQTRIDLLAATLVVRSDRGNGTAYQIIIPLDSMTK